MDHYKLSFTPIKNLRQSPSLKNSKSYSQERYHTENESKMQNDFMKFINNKQFFERKSNLTQDQLFESFLLFRHFVNSLVKSKDDLILKASHQYNDSQISNSSLKIIEENPTSESQQEKTSNKNIRIKIRKNNINNSINSNNICNNNNINIKIRKNYVNHDDIPIKQNNSNFVDLVEKNLEEMKNSPDSYREVSFDRNAKSKIYNNKRNKGSKIASNNKLAQSMNITKNNKDIKYMRSDSQTSNISNPIQVSSLREKSFNRHFEAEEETIRQDDFLCSNIININDPLNCNINKHLIPIKSPRFGSCSNILINNKKLEKMNSFTALQQNESQSDSEYIIDNNSNPIEESLIIEESQNNFNNSKQKNQNLTQEIRPRSTSKNKEDAAENVSQLLQEIKASTNAINASLCSPIISYSNKKKAEETKLKKELNKEIQRIKEEKAKIELIKSDYEQKNSNLLKEIHDYKRKVKKKEKNQNPIVDSLKTEEIFQLKRSQKKDKELINELKNQIQAIKEEKKLKEMTLKITIDKLQLQLQKAKIKINELLSNQTFLNNKIRNKEMSAHKSCSNILSSASTKLTPPMTKSKNWSPIRKPACNSMTLTNDNSETFKLVFPPKYKIEGGNIEVINEERAKDDKIIRIYSNKAKEIIYPSGSRKICFEDGYQIYYFSNKDIKQIFPNGKCVYYYSEAKATQTTLPDNTNVYKLKNGKIEKHYPNGNREIIYPDGKAKTIASNGSVELPNPLFVQRKEGNTLITSDSMQS